MCGVFMDATFHGGSNDTIGGRVRHRRPQISPIFSYPWQLPTSMASLFLSSSINFSPVSTTLAITENPGGTDSWKKNWSRKSRVRLPLNIEAKRTVLGYNFQDRRKNEFSPKFSKIKNKTNCLSLNFWRSKHVQVVPKFWRIEVKRRELSQNFQSRR